MGDRIGDSGGGLYGRDAVVAFEDRYYVQMPDEVQEAVSLRDEGWNALREDPKDQEAFAKIGGSVELQTDHSAKAPWVPVHGKYSRELYASLVRCVQASFVTGQHDEHDTRLAIRRAAMLTPNGVEVNTEEGELEVWPDQYEIILGGRLALATATLPGAYGRAWRMAAVARLNAGLSENRDRVVFANREMGSDERRETADRFGKVAWIASGSLLLPRAARVKVAQKILAK